MLIGICLLALAHAAWFNHTADDAFISFRYVDNWVRGYGLVFNPGERVMGYSNFLWVVLLYPFALIGVPLDTAGCETSSASHFAGRPSRSTSQAVVNTLSRPTTSSRFDVCRSYCKTPPQLTSAFSCGAAIRRSMYERSATR